MTAQPALVLETTLEFACDILPRAGDLPINAVFLEHTHDVGTATRAMCFESGIQVLGPAEVMTQMMERFRGVDEIHEARHILFAERDARRRLRVADLAAVLNRTLLGDADAVWVVDGLAVFQHGFDVRQI